MNKNILMFFILASVSPFLYLFRDGISLFLVANTSGLIGATLLLWQFILGNRFISSKFNKNYSKINKLHQQLGKYGVILVFMHPFFQMAVYEETLSFIFVPRLGSEFLFNVALGRMAFYLLIVIFVTSVLVRKKLKYRPWLYIHYLAYPALFLSFLHAGQIGTLVNYNPFISLYWQLVTIVFILGLIWRVLAFLNLTKYKYRLHSKKEVAKDIFLYKFETGAKPISIRPGQFLYLRTKHLFSEAHPYSIYSIEKSGEFISLGIKVVGKHSDYLSKLTKGDLVYIDGPYGDFTKQGQNEKPKVILAGGIGVTPFYQLVKDYSNDSTYMFYANKTLSDAVERSFYKDKLGDNYVDILSREKRKSKNIEHGRINKKILKKYLDPEIIDNGNYFICGSSGFMDTATGILKELGVAEERMFKEEFSL